MSTSEKRDPRPVSQPQTGQSRLSLIGRHTCPVAVAIFGSLLSDKVLVPDAFFIVYSFHVNPALAGAALFIACVVFFLCIFGVGKRSRVIGLVSRVILLFLSVVSEIASMEAISFGLISVTVTASREGFVWVSIAIVLVACAALGLKTALDWWFSELHVFSAVLSTLIFATFGLSIFSLM